MEHRLSELHLNNLSHDERYLLRLCRHELQAMQTQLCGLRSTLLQERSQSGIAIQVKVLLARVTCLSTRLVTVAAQREKMRAGTRGGARSVQHEKGQQEIRSSNLAAARLESGFHSNKSTHDMLVLEPKYRVDTMHQHIVSVTPFSSIRRLS